MPDIFHRGTYEAAVDCPLQLHCPAHQALLQIRNLFVGQTALAANYLATLNQMRIRN